MEICFGEHLKEADLSKRGCAVFRLKIAQNIVLNKHMVSRGKVTLLNHISDTRQLDAVERLEIYKTSNDELLNRDQGNSSFSSGALADKIIIRGIVRREE